MEKIKSFIHQYWFIILVTLVAAVLRLYRLESSLMFLGDQGRDAIVLKRILIDHDLPFIGPITSVGGFYLGPLYYYLMTPFLWLFKYNPVGPAIATAIIGVITTPVLYFVAKKMFSTTTARWASFLFAIGFIPVSETRSAWNPNPMPLASLGLIYGLYLVNQKKKPAGLILTSISLAVALQLHYMIVFLTPFLIWQLILIIKNKKNYPFFIKSIIGFLILMLPLILFEIKNNFLNFKGLLSFFNTNQYSSLSLIQVIKDVNGRAEQAIGMILGFGRDFSLIRTWLTRTFLVLISWFLLKNKKPQFILLSAWLLSSIIALAVYHSNVYPHYLGFLFPVVYIIVARVISQFKYKLIFIPFLFSALFIYFNLPQLQSLLTSQGNLQQVKETANLISNDIESNQHQQVNLALIDDTRDYRASNYRYFLELDQSIDLLDYDQYPATSILYLISPYTQPNVLSLPQWEVQSLKPAQVINSWEDKDQDKIYKIQPL